MTYSGVFFDLYGTLLIYGDMETAWAEWLEVFYASLCRRGLTVSKTAFAETCNNFFARAEPESDGDNLTVYERRIRAHCQAIGLHLDTEALRNTADETAQSWQKYITPDPDAIPVLTELAKTKKLALISDFDHPPHLYKLLKNFRLEPFFQSVIVSGEVGITKPDPGIFKPALEQTGVEPNRVIYVGDTIKDVQGALAAGLTPVLIKRDDDNKTRMDYSNGGVFDGYTDADRNHTARVISSLKTLIEIAG
ncbi:MAG: HAD family hydrolase [candidate division Zixibacteria bacterium]|nr:HAD family hydrolase [candidate division Zixibacteria bacterium]